MREYCGKCGRERPNYIADPTCNSPIGGYCEWMTEVPVHRADERAVRARLVALRNEIEALARRAGELFQTNGWVRTSEEAPPIKVQVFGIRFGDYAWYTNIGDGDWRVCNMRGNVHEGPGGPDFWMVLPPTPKDDR